MRGPAWDRFLNLSDGSFLAGPALYCLFHLSSLTLLSSKLDDLN